MISLPSSRGGFSCQCFFSLIRSIRFKVWFNDLVQRVLLDSAIPLCDPLGYFGCVLSGSLARIIVYSARDSSDEFVCVLPGSMASGIIVLSARDPSGLISLYSLPGSIASGIVILSAHDSSGLICLYSLPGSVATGIIVLSARDPAGNFLCNYRPVQGGSECKSCAPTTHQGYCVICLDAARAFAAKTCISTL